MIETTLALSLALGAMNGPLATTAQLKTVSQVPPAIAGPTAPAAAWDKVIEIVTEDGVYTPAKPGASLVYYALTEKDNTPLAKHMTRSAILVGELRDGKVSLTRAVFAETVLTKTAAGFTQEVWSIGTDPFGQVVTAKLITTIYSRDLKEVEKTPIVELDPADPKVKARFDDIIRHWSRF